jgi:hypothetical protein
MDASSPFCTVIVPYYNQPEMLRVHLDIWAAYDKHVRENLRLVIVDDGSMKQAEKVIFDEFGDPGAMLAGIDLQLYRIDKDIPWNRGGARNLGSTEALTPWLLHMDIDHIMPPTSAAMLVERRNDFKPAAWYRFRRFRYGAADDTRMKDALPRDQKFGEIKPHIDSYLVTKTLYWKAGGYNEDFSGCLGGGSPFLRELEKVGGVREAPPDICLHVYTRDTCVDASALDLSRDRTEYSRRSKELTRKGKIKGHDPLRFEWKRVL